MEYLLVAIGGALGSLVRFLIGKRIAERIRTGFPVGTFFINITGAILLGTVSSVGLSGNMYSFLGTGFLGAYTTFSTFMYEGFNLFQDNEQMNALVYILGTFILGIIGFILGVQAVNFIEII